MSQLADRYATALFEVTKKSGTSQQVMETLIALRNSLDENKKVFGVLSNPMISDSDKKTVLIKAIGPQSGSELETFFQLLVKNNRLAAIPQIATAFENKMSKEMGMVSGEVQSAVELTEQEKERVKKLIESKLSSSVDLKFKVNPNMIGGIEAKVGSYIFEDSVKSHFEKLNDFITRRVQ